MNERTLEACDAVKAEGIDLYTITFEVHDLDKPTMVACASSGMDYDSPTTDQLDDVFEEIAARLNVLRISK
jgi:hypothetical protein